MQDNQLVGRNVAKEQHFMCSRLVFRKLKEEFSKWSG